jgi:hypothetical protein
MYVRIVIYMDTVTKQVGTGNRTKMWKLMSSSAATTSPALKKSGSGAHRRGFSAENPGIPSKIPGTSGPRREKDFEIIGVFVTKGTRGKIRFDRGRGPDPFPEESSPG